MMVSTPPRRSTRARTPPAPRHGPKEDDYEPYSPRRSTRSTLSRNPYSSFNSDRSLDRKNETSRERTPVRQRGGYTTPPPTTARKRARFAQTVPQLSSPPSSPIDASPGMKTPRRTRRSTRFSTSPVDKTGPGTCDTQTSPSLGSTSLRTTFALLTPSKTPTRRTPANVNQKRDFSTFVQPASPSHVMPPSRKIRRYGTPTGLDLDSSPSAGHSGRRIDVYTDPQSRIAELDTSENNPFVTKRNVSSDVEMSNGSKSVRRADHFNEGVMYMKRGKKIFRPFAGSDTTYVDSPDVEIGAPLRYNSKIKSINPRQTKYEARPEINTVQSCDEAAESSAGPINAHGEQGIDSSLHLMNCDMSDSEASTLSGGEASPTLAYSSYRRNARKANVTAPRSIRTTRKTTYLRSMPLDDPFTNS